MTAQNSSQVTYVKPVDKEIVTLPILRRIHSHIEEARDYLKTINYERPDSKDVQKRIKQKKIIKKQKENVQNFEKKLDELDKELAKVLRNRSAAVLLEKDLNEMYTTTMVIKKWAVHHAMPDYLGQYYLNPNSAMVKGDIATFNDLANTIETIEDRISRLSQYHDIELKEVWRESDKQKFEKLTIREAFHKYYDSLRETLRNYF